METNQMVSLDQMVQEAVQAGYGEPQKLRRLFVAWQESGLLGKAATKAPRRGGEGLWHPDQHTLWRLLLEQRARGAGRVALANLSVALWLQNFPGIEVAQAQRAFGLWLRANPSTGPRSVAGRGIDHHIDQVSVPGTSARSQRELRDLFLRMTEAAFARTPGVPTQLPVSTDSIAGWVLDVVAPGATPPTKAQRYVARGPYLGPRIQFRALDYEKVLLQNRAEIHLYWAWARLLLFRSLERYLKELPVLQADSDVAHIFQVPVLAEYLGSGCRMLLMGLGAGLDPDTRPHAEAIAGRAPEIPPPKAQTRKTPRRR